MPSVTTPALFQPITLGRSLLKHRVVMAPLTRYKADDSHVHSEMGIEYYTQRASTPGTLLISEGTFISPQAGGYENVPGIYTPAQVSAWKRIVEAVHAKGSYIYLQLWALGRAAKVDVLTREGITAYVSASAQPLEGRAETPRAITISEIRQYVEDYAQAARNAVEAGFDGIEIHAANGYLIDQLMQDVSNKRTDEYGGSIERRARFALEIVEAVVDAIGQDRTAIRFSPWGVYQGMRMADPVPQFSYVIQKIRDLYPKFAYIHLVEPPVGEVTDMNPGSNDPFRKIWAPRPLLSANGHTPETAFKVAEEKGDLVAFGRYFISNPDLPLRLQRGLPVTPYNPKTFYVRNSAAGYTDWPFAEENVETKHRVTQQLDPRLR